MFKHGNMWIPTGEIRSQDVLLMHNSGARMGVTFWVGVVFLLIVEIVVIRSTFYDNVEEKYLMQPDYRITACEVEEAEDFYLLEVTFENMKNFPVEVHVECDSTLEVVSDIYNVRTTKPIEEVVLPAYSETTVTYQAAKSWIGEDGLVLKLTDTYEPQEWEVTLP